MMTMTLATPPAGLRLPLQRRRRRRPRWSSCSGPSSRSSAPAHALSARRDRRLRLFRPDAPASSGWAPTISAATSSRASSSAPATPSASRSPPSSIACASGVVLGMTAAVTGGWLDTVLSRLLDALNSIPSQALRPRRRRRPRLRHPGADRHPRGHLHPRRLPLRPRARGQRQHHGLRRRRPRPRRAHALPDRPGDPAEHPRTRCSPTSACASSSSCCCSRASRSSGLGVQPPDADWGSLVRENIGGLPFGAPAVHDALPRHRQPHDQRQPADRQPAPSRSATGAP